MALGNVSVTTQSGAGQVGGGAALAVRTVILFGVSPSGTPTSLYQLSSQAGIKSALDYAILGEACAKLLQRGAPSVWACPVTPSSAGGVAAAVTQAGVGGGAGLGSGTVTPSLAPHIAIKVKCITGGSLGTATFQFSLDGGTTYGATVTSDSSAPWTYRVPGLFCTLSFASATYVSTKTLTVAIDGTVTAGSGWVGTVTQASSPLNNYDVVVNVIKAGALGTATVQVSLDGNKSTLPTMLVPSSGTLVISGTGLVLTLASTFVAGETYSFACATAGYSTSDASAALTAAMAAQGAPQVALVYFLGLPSSAAGAVSLGSTIDSALATARSADYQKFWYGLSDCPSSVSGDTVMSGGYAIVDSADTDAVIRAARVGSTFNWNGLAVGTNRMKSAITPSLQVRYPTGLTILAAIVGADPSQDPADVGRGPLDVSVIGRDEFTAAASLHDAQFNVLRTYPGRGTDAYLAIESGGVGWRNLTTDPNYQDAGFIRMFAAMVAAVNTAAQKYLGSRQSTNTDGTIAEGARQRASADLDGVAKRAVGLLPGGAFTAPQMSSAGAEVLPTSQLGNAPRRLDVQLSAQSLGFTSAVSIVATITH